jgi:hypothetical protein
MGVACSACCNASVSGPNSQHIGADLSLGPDLSTEFSCFKLGPGGSFSVTNFNLHEDPARTKHVKYYYSMCTKATGLHVTTSCFSIWRQHKKTNGYAKVIPATRVVEGDERPCHVFFFDDNLEWDGLESSSGICNLRDIYTGQFIDFGVGRNGFERATAARHTVIHHSKKYNSVLVKANILDAVEDADYFSRIVQTYAAPEEKVLIFMDVNSTIVCNDAVQSKDLSSSLLSTMFEFMELAPKAGAFEFIWQQLPPVKVEKRQTLKKLVKDITEGDIGAYRNFFSEMNCCQFIEQLIALADVRWADGETTLSVEDFVNMFKEYLATVSGGVDRDGIASSWFRCFDALKNDHAVVLNSFGVDTRKVIKATVPDEKNVMQIAVNYELWEKRDLEKFEAQFND